MGKKYRNPPVIETICEFRLTEDTPWDLTVAGLIYGKIQDKFPHKERRFVQEETIIQSPQGIQHQTRVSEQVLFLTETKTIWVQVGPHLVAIHCVKPYPTWEGFEPYVKNVLDAFTKAVDVKVWERIGLRYINRIEIPSSGVKLDDYFAFYPFVGPTLPQTIIECRGRGVFLFLDGRDACAVQLTHVVSETPNHISFLLDLDYFLSQPKAVIINQTWEWVDTAHQHIEEMFEGCITDSLRGLFQEIP